MYSTKRFVLEGYKLLKKDARNKMDAPIVTLENIRDKIADLKR